MLIGIVGLAIAGAGPGAAQPDPREASSTERPLRLGFVTDAQEEGNGREQLKDAIRRLGEMNASVLLYGGDTNYGYQDPPDDWREAMEPFANRTLFVYGNHDSWKGYEPYHPPGPDDKTWWTWQRGATIIVGLDTNEELWPGSDQAEWLETTLVQHRNATVVLLLHKPWWVVSEGHAPEDWVQADPSHMDRLVRTHGVDMVLGGHEHYYSRMVRNGTLYLIGGPVEAHARQVPESVANASQHATTNETWTYFDLLSCGIAGWTYDARQHSLRDQFTFGSDILIEDGRAARRPPPPTREARETTPGPATPAGAAAPRNVPVANATREPPDESVAMPASLEGGLTGGAVALAIGLMVGAALGYLAGRAVGRKQGPR